MPIVLQKVLQGAWMYLALMCPLCGGLVLTLQELMLVVWPKECGPACWLCAAWLKGGRQNGLALIALLASLDIVFAHAE